MAELPVALDAMGGDNGPAPNVEGAIAAVKEDGARVILVGNEAMLAPLVKGVDGIEIRHAPDVVAMDDKPALAARKKKESSMRIACDLVGDGVACGALSAGNSGAMMAVALLVFGRVDGVMRPAIGTMLPSLGDLGLVHLVDAGANIECEPAHLAQFAVLGNEYVKRTFALEQPRVGVLSNGEEDGKGTELTRASLDLVRKLPLNVHGYVEGRELNTGLVHVIVTDGFTGNVMLKTAEGVFKFVTGQIRHGYEHGSLKEKLGALMSQSMFERMRKKLDPREFGAAPLLGLAKPAFIAHGSSDAYSIRRGIGAVRSYAKADLVKHMTAAIAQAAPLLRAEEAGVSELPSTSVALMGSGASAVELPTKLTVTRAPGVFEVSWKWREQVSRATFFAPLMTSLSAIGGLTNVAVHAPIVAGVAALGLLGIVGGFSAAYAKNTMRVRVTQGALVLTSGPIGGRTVEIAADDVVDVVAAQRQVRARRPALWSVTLLMKSAPGEKPKKPRPIVGFMMQQAQAEEIARLVRDALFRA